MVMVLPVAWSMGFPSSSKTTAAGFVISVTGIASVLIGRFFRADNPERSYKEMIGGNECKNWRLKMVRVSASFHREVIS